MSTIKYWPIAAPTLPVPSIIPDTVPSALEFPSKLGCVPKSADIAPLSRFAGPPSKKPEIGMRNVKSDGTIELRPIRIQSSTFDALYKYPSKTEVQNITINTGFIPKDNQYYIDLIIRSRKAWLLNNNTEPLVELVAQTKELTNTDSDQELYAYDVTFQINRTHDFQNYS